MSQLIQEATSDDELRYGRAVFEAILEGTDHVGFARDEFVCKEAGAWLKDVKSFRNDLSLRNLAWHPWSEAVFEGSPDPLEEPWLPFPFTARQLAAMMIEGVGSFIRVGDPEQACDWWTDDTNDFDSVKQKPREALLAAYEAIRHANASVPLQDEHLEAIADDFAKKYNNARDAAIEREHLRERGISEQEYSARLARVNAAVEDIGRQLTEAKNTASAAQSRWRATVTRRLLLPVPDLPDEALENLFSSTPPKCLQGNTELSGPQIQHCEPDPRGPRLRQLVVHHLNAEKTLRRWLLLEPTSVTDEVQRDTKIAETRGQLAELKEQIRSLYGLAHLGGNGSRVQPSGEDQKEYPESRQRRRLDDLKRLGGNWVYRHGKWGAKDKNGAFAKLVEQERQCGAANSSEKSVRADLAAAAQREADELRSATALPGRNMRP